MIVFYNQPNTLTLPYTMVIDGKKVNDFFKFVPGKNYIDKNIWIEISKAAGDDMDYYSTILSVFQPIEDKETGEVIGEEIDDVDISKLSVHEFRELIDNTMEKEPLYDYLDLEKSRTRPRTSILRSLKDRITKISDAEESLKKKNEDNE